MTATTSPRPFAMPLNVAGLPRDPVMAGPHFLDWRWAEKPGKPGEWTKPPFNARTGYPASVTNPAHHAALACALEGVGRHGMDGIGLALTKPLGITALDLDHCRDRDTGAIAPWARAIIERFASYWEPSASGTGVRILIRASLPAGGKKRGDIEAYDDGRYVTINGNRGAGAPGTIEPRQAELDAFLAEHFPAPPPRAEPPRPAPRPVDKSDAELLALALERSPRFARLWSGDYGEVAGDESRGDWRLAWHLLFWLGGDAERVERVMRAAPARREKWDERRRDTTWLRHTIDKAAGEQTEYYDPLWRPNGPTFDITGEAGTPPPPDDEIAVLLRGLDREELERWALAQHARAAAAERQRQQGDRLLALIGSLLANEHIGPAERIVLLKLAFEYTHRVEAGEAEDGFAPIRLGETTRAVRARVKKEAIKAGVAEEEAERVAAGERGYGLAQACGLDAKTVSKVIAKLDFPDERENPHGWGIIEKRTRHGRTPDGAPRSDVLVKLGGTQVIDILTPLRDFRPEQARNHGGKRTPCPRCGSVETVTTVRCSGCDLVLKRTVQVAPPAGDAPVAEVPVADVPPDSPPPMRDDGPQSWAAVLDVATPWDTEQPVPAPEPAAEPASAPATLPLVAVPTTPPAETAERSPYPAGTVTYHLAAPGRPRCMNRACNAPMPAGAGGRYCPGCVATGQYHNRPVARLVRGDDQASRAGPVGAD